MENVFGKNWSPSDVQEAFDQRGDYDDGDLVDSDLFVSIEGNERLIPMGNIKVKYVDILFKSSMLNNYFRKHDFGDYQGGNFNSQTVLNNHNAIRKKNGLGSFTIDPFVSTEY